MDEITQILENVVRCKYYKAGVHIKNPIKNSYKDGLGRTPQTLDHVVVVHILLWDKRKSQINEYSDNFLYLSKYEDSNQVGEIITHLIIANEIEICRCRQSAPCPRAQSCHDLVTFQLAQVHFNPCNSN